MRLFATAALLSLVFAAPASAQFTSRVHNTGTAALRVFNNGYYGANTGTPAATDTTFNFGTTAPRGPLYEGQLVVAVSPTQVSGSPYSDNPDGQTPNSGTDWTFGPRPAPVTPPAPFNQALQTTYTDGGINNPDPAGLTVAQRTLSRTGDAFVIVEVNVSSNSARSGVYVGMFADYDISPTAVADRGGFEATTRTVYAFNGAAGGNRNYYGVSLLGRTQSGWSVSTGTAPDLLYTSMTTAGTAATTGADRRLIVGAGPFTLAANVPQLVRFAYVAGTSLADLTANAAVAQGLFPTGTSESPEAAGVRLLPSAPNPASAAATLAFTLDAAQAVRLAVYDVLGREVAVVADGTFGAGTHRPTVDTSALPAGVYVARLTAAGTTTAQRFTVAR